MSPPPPLRPPPRCCRSSQLRTPAWRRSPEPSGRLGLLVGLALGLLVGLALGLLRLGLVKLRVHGRIEVLDIDQDGVGKPDVLHLLGDHLFSPVGSSGGRSPQRL